MISLKKLFGLICVASIAVATTSCKDEVSYSDRLNSERHATNAFLANNRIVNEIPADTVFETGVNAPYYKIDPEGNVYMQVLNAGDRKNDKAKTGQTIYFRFTRYNLEEWYSQGVLSVYESNESDMSLASASFKYKDFTLSSSSKWGYGIQLPLELLGTECEVNLVIKSQYGFSTEIAYVLPFLFHVRYFHSRI